MLTVGLLAQLTLKTVAKTTSKIYSGARANWRPPRSKPSRGSPSG
jgi:hypothetical protein